jgi:hypothetical protein
VAEADDPRDSALREAYAGLSRTSDAHLDDATWERLACGELRGGEREAALAHVVACAECSELWRGLDALREGARAFDPQVPRVGSAAPQGVQRPWLPAVAACLAIAVAGLAGLSLSLRSDVARLRGELGSARRAAAGTAALPNAAVVDLANGGTWRGAGNEPPVLDASAPLTVFLIEASDVAAFPDYGARIVDAQGRTLWSGDGLTRNRFDGFSLAVPRALLPHGKLELELAGVRGGRRVPLRDYSFEVR